MSLIRKAYVDVSAGQVHYRYVAGKGMPVVFLHQTASSSQMWIKTMDRLAGEFSVFALDTPGFGGSFDPTGNPPMTQYVEWLREALLALGIKRAQIVGHHTGGCIGTELVARHPEMAQSLAVVGPVPLTAEERLAFSKSFGLPFNPTVSGGYLLDNWQYIRDLGAAKDVMLFHREMTDQMRAWWGRVMSYGAVWGQDWTTHYKNVKCPLWIGAAPDDVLYPVFDRAREIRPDAEAHVLEGANFEPDLGTDRFLEALTPFLRKHGG